MLSLIVLLGCPKTAPVEPAAAAEAVGAEECAICLQPLLARGQTKTLACGHTFHRAPCLQNWFRRSRCCPVCREPWKEHSPVGRPLVRSLITNHLENITANRLPRIARATGHTLEEVKHAIEAMRTLDPYPGREYGEQNAETIHPDVVVEVGTERFEARASVAAPAERLRIYDEVVAQLPRFGEYREATEREIPVVLLARTS